MINDEDGRRLVADFLTMVGCTTIRLKDQEGIERPYVLAPNEATFILVASAVNTDTTLIAVPDGAGQFYGVIYFHGCPHPPPAGGDVVRGATKLTHGEMDGAMPVNPAKGVN